MPGYAYGINYEFGLFRQASDGYQLERPDNWRREMSPWLIPRPEEACMIPVYGRIEHRFDRDGEYGRCGSKRESWSACRRICRFQATASGGQLRAPVLRRGFG